MTQITNEKIEYACRDIVFHFNKKHLEDQTIPMWVLKLKGKSLYVNHVTAEIPWSTKETSDNPHTKGSIKFKNCLCTIDENNCATLSVLTEEDKIRLGAIEKQPLVVWYEGSSINLEQILNDREIEHQGVLKTSGSCTTDKQMAGIYNEADVSLLLLLVPRLRVLNENEIYHKQYLRWIKEDKSEKYENDVYDWDDEDEEDEEKENVGRGFFNFFKRLSA